MGKPTEKEFKKIRKTLRALMLKEKKRRGLSKDDMVFVGIRNVAGYTFCPMQALISSREMEELFFASYLGDRFKYASQFGLFNKLSKKIELDEFSPVTLVDLVRFINKFPKKDVLLDIVAEVTFEDVNRILSEELLEWKEGEKREGVFGSQRISITDKEGNVRIFIDPDSSKEQRELAVGYAKAENPGKEVRLADLEEEPTIRGQIIECKESEEYPKKRWNFEWDKYVFVGIPDGITERFVYEFKTSRNRYLMNLKKPEAFMQADLYGYFFERREKRVQIYIMEERKSETWEDKVDRKNVEKTLKSFSKLDAGWMPLRPEEAWKCKRCEWKSKCSIV